MEENNRKNQEEQKGKERIKRVKPQRNQKTKDTRDNSQKQSKKVYRKGGRKRNRPNPLTKDIKEALKLNRVSDDNRMHPYKQISVGNKGKLRFTPLGGLGEIGGNIAVLEDDESAIIIDVGMSFSRWDNAWE